VVVRTPVVVVDPLVVVVPALGGYLIPLEGHEPALGASEVPGQTRRNPEEVERFTNGYK
jgi:hypothetical protein